MTILSAASRNNSVYTEICGCQRVIDCADFQEVNDAWGGKLQSAGATEPSNGNVIEMNRWRAYQPSSGVLSVPLAYSEHFFNLRDKRCETSIQVRPCTDKDTVLHFSGVQIDSFRISNLTASGAFAQDAVPMVSIPVLYRRMYRIERGRVTGVDAGANGIEKTIVGVAYCHCEGCCGGCGECVTVWRLFQDGTLEVSHDGGVTWANIPHCITGVVEGLWCMNGRLFVSTFGEGLWYSDNPESNPYSWVKVFRDKGQVVWLKESGLVLFAAVQTSTATVIYKSIDAGVNWIKIHELLGFFKDFDTDGDYLVLVSMQGRIAGSSDGGLTWWETTMIYDKIKQDLVAVDIHSAPHGTSSCFTLSVATENNSIYQTTDWKTWRRVRRGKGGSELYHRAYLVSAMEGATLWYHRIINGKPTTIRSIGDCCDWEVFDHTISTGMEVPQSCAFYGCFNDDCQVTALFYCPSMTVPLDLSGEVLYGCVTDDEVLIFTCGDCQEQFIGNPNPCQTCEERECAGEVGACDNCNYCLPEFSDEPIIYGCVSDEEEEGELLAFACGEDFIGQPNHGRRCLETTMPHCPSVLDLIGCQLRRPDECCPEPDYTEYYEGCESISVENGDDYALIVCTQIVDDEEICYYISCKEWDIECVENEYLPIEPIEVEVGTITMVGEHCYLSSPCDADAVLTLCDAEIVLTDPCGGGSSGCATGCEKEMMAGLTSVWAFCPANPNISISIGSEVLLSI